MKGGSGISANCMPVQHTAKHRPRNVQCICCDLDFPTISAFFNHMESGTCPSGIDCEDPPPSFRIHSVSCSSATHARSRSSACAICCSIPRLDRVERGISVALAKSGILSNMLCAVCATRFEWPLRVTRERHPTLRLRTVSIWITR
jgi:hypothetical protein